MSIYSTQTLSNFSLIFHFFQSSALLTMIRLPRCSTERCKFHLSASASHTRQQQQQWVKKKKNNFERVGVEVARVSRVSSSLLPLHEDRCRYVFFSQRYTRPQKRLRLSLQLSLSSFSPSSPVDFRCSTWSKRTRACPRFNEVGNFQFLFTSACCCFFCAAFALSFYLPYQWISFSIFDSAMSKVSVANLSLFLVVLYASSAQGEL